MPCWDLRNAWSLKPLVSKLDQWLMATAALLFMLILLQPGSNIKQETYAQDVPLNLVNIKWPSPPSTDPGVSNQHDGEASFIQIQWPAGTEEREKIRQVLHQCLGVSLAKLDSKGKINVRERASKQAYSQYVRQFSQPMDGTDAKLENFWREVPGRLVRLYPVALDQRIFAGIGLTQRAVNVTGRFRWQQNSLIMTHITVDSEIRPGLIKLYGGNPAAC
jgi:hypothetical protein